MFSKRLMSNQVPETFLEAGVRFILAPVFFDEIRNDVVQIKINKWSLQPYNFSTDNPAFQNLEQNRKATVMKLITWVYLNKGLIIDTIQIYMIKRINLLEAKDYLHICQEMECLHRDLFNKILNSFNVPELDKDIIIKALASSSMFAKRQTFVWDNLQRSSLEISEVVLMFALFENILSFPLQLSLDSLQTNEGNNGYPTMNVTFGLYNRDINLNLQFWKHLYNRCERKASILKFQLLEREIVDEELSILRALNAFQWFNYDQVKQHIQYRVRRILAKFGLNLITADVANPFPFE